VLDLFAVSVVMIRLLAILIIVNAVAAIPTVFAYIRQVSWAGELENSPDVSTLVALLSYPVLAAVLLIFSRKFGRLVTRGLDNTVVQLDQTHYTVLQAAVFSVLGAYILVYSIPALINVIVFAVLPALRENEGALVKTTVPVERLVQELIKTVLGIWLLFGWKAIVASIRSTWKKGISVESPE
jgi:flagellar biosynthesis protein FlhB